MSEPTSNSPFWERWLWRSTRSTPRGALEFLIVALCFGLADPNEVSLLVGGSVSAWYLYDVSQVSRYVFQERWLRERYGKEPVQLALINAADA